MRMPTWLVERVRPRTFGERGELLAGRFLRSKGYRLVARRDRSRIGELDLIAVDGRTVVFVEVKTRRSDQKGHPADAVDTEKQRRLTRAALTFLKSHGLLDHPARFDVVAITWPIESRKPVIRHFENAFQAVGSGQFFS